MEPKSARVLFDDPVGNMERQQRSEAEGTPGRIYNDLANKRQPKSKAGGKPVLQKYVASDQQPSEL